MNFLNNLQKVCRVHIILLLLIQLLFVFFAQRASAKNNPSAAGVGDDGCASLVVSAQASRSLTCVSPTAMLTATSSTPGATYSWSGPNAFASTWQITAVTLPGIYTVTVTDPASGCATQASVKVLQDIAVPANVTAVSLDTLGCSITFGWLQATSTTTDAVFVWTPQDDPSFVQDGPEALALYPGIWKVRVTNPTNGCSVERAVDVLFDETPPTCSLTPASGANVLHNSVNTISTAAKSTYMYQWASPSWIILAGQGTNSVTYLAGNTGTSSTISVHIEDHRGCISDCSATLTAVATKSATAGSLQGVAFESNEVALNTYPTPSNSKVSVEFSLPESTDASIDVFDAQGKLVTSLFKGEAQAHQTYSLAINEKGELPAGVYLCILKTKTKSVTKKVVIRP